MENTTMKSPITKIPAAEAAGHKNAVWLDVRTPAEYTEHHIDGSVLHPLSNLDAAAVKNLAGDRACVVVCRSGNRASQAAEKLAAAGVSSVHVLDGGILAWEAANLPVNRGAKTMSLERQVRIAAGAMVFAGTLLGVFVQPWFLVVPGFVGAGLVFAGITDTCGMGMLLARMPWNQRGATCPSCKV